MRPLRRPKIHKPNGRGEVKQVVAAAFLFPPSLWCRLASECVKMVVLKVQGDHEVLSDIDILVTT